jgi:anti-sigma regulatory factor (Ser/Thr protein kinase)
MSAGDPLERETGGPAESAGFLRSGDWRAKLVQHEKIDIPGGLRAPQSARRAIEQHFGGAMTAELLASVELLATELVSNAVRHGGAGDGDQVVLHLGLTRDRLRVEVCDHGPGFEPGQPQPYGEGGYGLFLVSEVASAWGVAHDDGHCAWFEMALPPRTGG